MSKFVNYSIFFLIALITISVSYAQEVSENEIKSIATTEFNLNVPSEYKNQYTLFEFGAFSKSTADTFTLYYAKWSRTVNNIPLVNDYFLVKIYSNGNVLTKEFHYSGPISQSDITYSITADQAKWVMKHAYNGNLTMEPTLAIDGKTLVWQMEMRIKQGLIWVDIDAKTGKTISFDANQGSSVQQVPTSFDPTRYYLDVYGLPAGIGIVVVLGLVYYGYSRRPKNTKNRKTKI